MTNALLFFKALHVVGFVSWFAGLFYLVRIFVYYTEAATKTAPEKDILQANFGKMQQRVYKIICNPAMMITWTAGLVMLGLGLYSPTVPNYLSVEMGTPGWMHLKLLLLVLLTVYHLWCKRIIKQLENNTNTFTPFQFRLFNELPTLFLVSIAYIAVYGKIGQLNYLYLLIGVALFALLVYRGAVAYKKRRMTLEQS